MDNQHLSITNDLHGANVLLAPNGKPSNLTPEQYFLVRTPEFKEWFGDWERLAMAKVKDPAMDEVTLANLSKSVSKVVDENGEPLVVYRGDSSKTNIFKGITFFSSNDYVAGSYSNEDAIPEYKVFLNIRNPLNLLGGNELRRTPNSARISGSDPNVVNIFKEAILNLPNDYTISVGYGDKWDKKTLYELVVKNYEGIEYINHNNQSASWEAIIKYAKTKVFDGVFMNDESQDRLIQFQFSQITFEPEQIKLADGSNTTFDGSNPDIRYAHGGLIAPNGKKSNLTPEQYKLVRTPEFKAWFGDWENDPKNASKVVDQNGEPLVVYHGTNASFTIFDTDEESQNRKGGIWDAEYPDGYIFMTSNKNVAKNYGQKVIPLFVNLVYPVTKKVKKGSSLVLPFDDEGLAFEGDAIVTDGIDYIVGTQDEYQVKLADGTNTTFDSSNPDIRFDGGGRVEHLIREGIVDLKMYDTTPKHAKEYGLQSINPLYIQTICVSESKRLKGLGKKVLAYIEKYAIENGHDVVFGHITQKAKFTKDERETSFCDIDMIKNWLRSNGYAINDNNNDFYKVISYSNPDIRFDGGGEAKAKFGDKYPKNQFIQLNENDIEYFADDLFDLIQNAYSHLGGHIEFSNIDSFKKTDLNFWIASDIDDDPNADVLLGGKYTDKGIKITLGGQDGNRLAKATMVSKMKDLMKQKGFYTEMDEELAKKLKLTPIQDFEEITKVLDKKEIKNLGNGVYERMIGGKLKQKVLVGLPSGRIDKSQKIQFDLGGKLFNNGGNMKKVDSGGITYGASHDNGGIPVKNASTGEMLEVEGGEGIVNKRSMASDKMVKLNGKEMSICEAVSKLNQMEGGVKFSCDDVEHRQFIEEMEYGGELERGERTEMEHIKVLKDLYAKRITPKQATKQIAKDHIKENPNYYTELSKIEKKMANGGKSDCGCSHHTTTKFSQGGQSDCGCGQNRFDNGGFVRGKGTIEDLIRSKSKQGDKTKEVITDTIIEARNLLDVDYLPIIKKNNFEFYNKYCVGFAHLNLYKMGWRFQFGTSREWAGLCDSRDRVEITRANLSKNKNLYVSINFVKHDANWSKNSKDVILHEIAHALVTEVFEKKMSQGALQNLDPKHFLLEGHGELWATMCKAINQDGSCSRFYANALLQESFKSYMYNCANCRTQRYSNSSTFTKNCFKCGSPVLVVKSKI